jgi:uncharacterized alpha-E superfamily protein
MLSRVADSLYWLSRYLERAEHSARLIDTHLNLMLDMSADSADRRWRRVLSCLPMQSQNEPPTETQEIIHELTFSTRNRSSIVSCISAARENARQVREQVSSEMWTQLNRLFHAVKGASDRDPAEGQPLEFLSAVKMGSLLFQGITDSTMNHGEGWQFMRLGRCMERALATAILVDAHFREFFRAPDALGEAADPLEWVGLLKSCTAFEAYCKVYTAKLSPPRIAEFLLLNAEFPHSARFCADRVYSALNGIEESTYRRKGASVRRLAGKLCSNLGFSQIDEILAGGLHPYLLGVQKECGAIHSAIHEVYIAYPIEAALEA